MSGASTDELILAIDQGTTNSKAVLISADGRVVAGGSAPVGISSPRPGWVEQDAEPALVERAGGGGRLPPKASPTPRSPVSRCRPSGNPWSVGKPAPECRWVP